MKKIIKPEDFPIEMNEENIEILARMKLNYPPPIKYPPTLEYLELLKLDLLSFEDQIQIEKKATEIKAQIEKTRWDSLTSDEQVEENGKIEASLKEGPEVFRGNILQQEWDSIELTKRAQEKKDKDDSNKS